MDNQNLVNGFWIALAAVVVVLLVVGLIVLLQIHPGLQRRRVTGRLKTFARLRGYRVLSNLSIPDGQGGSLHVDNALVGYFGVLFLTVLSEDGDYYGEETAERWLRVTKGVKTYFPNPLQQGETMMNAVRKVFSKNNVYNTLLDHWVVFTPSFSKRELAVKASLQTINVRKLGSLLDRAVFEKDNGLDLEKVVRLLEAGANQ